MKPRYSAPPSASMKTVEPDEDLIFPAEWDDEDDANGGLVIGRVADARHENVAGSANGTHTHDLAAAASGTHSHDRAAASSVAEPTQTNIATKDKPNSFRDVSLMMAAGSLTKASPPKLSSFSRLPFANIFLPTPPTSRENLNLDDNKDDLEQASQVALPSAEQALIRQQLILLEQAYIQRTTNAANIFLATQLDELSLSNQRSIATLRPLIQQFFTYILKQSTVEVTFHSQAQQDTPPDALSRYLEVVHQEATVFVATYLPKTATEKDTAKETTMASPGSSENVGLQFNFDKPLAQQWQQHSQAVDQLIINLFDALYIAIQDLYRVFLIKTAAPSNGSDEASASIAQPSNPNLKPTLEKLLSLLETLLQYWSDIQHQEKITLYDEFRIRQSDENARIPQLAHALVPQWETWNNEMAKDIDVFKCLTMGRVELKESEFKRWKLDWLNNKKAAARSALLHQRLALLKMVSDKIELYNSQPIYRTQSCWGIEAYLNYLKALAAKLKQNMSRKEGSVSAPTYYTDDMSSLVLRYTGSLRTRTAFAFEQVSVEQLNMANGLFYGCPFLPIQRPAHFENALIVACHFDQITATLFLENSRLINCSFKDAQALRQVMIDEKTKFIRRTDNTRPDQVDMDLWNQWLAAQLICESVITPKITRIQQQNIRLYAESCANKLSLENLLTVLILIGKLPFGNTQQKGQAALILVEYFLNLNKHPAIITTLFSQLMSIEYYLRLDTQDLSYLSPANLETFAALVNLYQRFHSVTEPHIPCFTEAQRIIALPPEKQGNQHQKDAPLPQSRRNLSAILQMLGGCATRARQSIAFADSLAGISLEGVYSDCQITPQMSFGVILDNSMEFRTLQGAVDIKTWIQIINEHVNHQYSDKDLSLGLNQVSHTVTLALKNIRQQMTVETFHQIMKAILTNESLPADARLQLFKKILLPLCDLGESGEASALATIAQKYKAQLLFKMFLSLTGYVDSHVLIAIMKSALTHTYEKFQIGITSGHMTERAFFTDPSQLLFSSDTSYSAELRTRCLQVILAEKSPPALSTDQKMPMTSAVVSAKPDYVVAVMAWYFHSDDIPKAAKQEYAMKVLSYFTGTDLKRFPFLCLDKNAGTVRRIYDLLVQAQLTVDTQDEFDYQSSAERFIDDTAKDKFYEVWRLLKIIEHPDNKQKTFNSYLDLVKFADTKPADSVYHRFDPRCGI